MSENVKTYEIGVVLRKCGNTKLSDEELGNVALNMAHYVELLVRGCERHGICMMCASAQITHALTVMLLGDYTEDAVKRMFESIVGGTLEIEW